MNMNSEPGQLMTFSSFFFHLLSLVLDLFLSLGNKINNNKINIGLGFGEVLVMLDINRVCSWVKQV